MTSASIAKTTLLSQAWENSYNLINTRTIVADPRDPENKGFRAKFVHRRHPSGRDTNADIYPYIVVNSPKIKFTQVSVDGTFKKVTWEQLVEVRTSDSDRARRDKGASDYDSIMDDLLALNHNSNQDTVRAYGMHFPKIEVSSQDTVTEDGGNLFISELIYTYETHMQMT